MTPKEMLEALQKVRALIVNPFNWTQYYKALDLNYKRVSTDSPEACKFCLLGAVEKTIGKMPDDETLIGMLGTDYEGVWIFNDNSTHAQVIELLDHRIRLHTEDPYA